MYIDAFNIDWSDLKFYAFPSISVISRVLSKMKQDSEEDIIVVPLWPSQVWYPVMLKMLVSTTILLNSRKSLLVLPKTHNLVHSMWKTRRMLVVHLLGPLQKAYHCQGMLLRSYQLFGEWEQENGTIHMSNYLSSFVLKGTQIPFKLRIEFLTEYLKTGLGHRSVNSGPSALSSIIRRVCNVLFGKSPLVFRLLKGVFNIRPALPRYVTTWDIIKIFTFIKSKPTLTNCDLKTLFLKLVILLCLTTDQRDQPIKCLNLKLINISSEKVDLLVPETWKTSRPGHHLPPIELTIFKYSELCVIAHPKQHVKMISPFRTTGTKQLLLSFLQLHKLISTTTLSMWCVTAINECGINVNIYCSNSTRSASASKCKISGLSFKEIAKSAGWSNKRKFPKLFDKSLKRTFQTICLDEICCFLRVYVSMVLFIQEAYTVLIIHKTILIRLRKILD